MLFVGRKPGEFLSIAPAREVDPSMPIGALFSTGPIEIKLLRVSGRRVTLGINAPDKLLIWRGSFDIDAKPIDEEDGLGSCTTCIT